MLAKSPKFGDAAALKQAIFMAIHVEQNAKWFEKLNNQILKCYEKIDRSNIIRQRVDRSEEEIETFEEYFA